MQVRDCTLCRECLREPELARKLRLSRKKDHFIFTVNTHTHTHTHIHICVCFLGLGGGEIVY